MDHGAAQMRVNRPSNVASEDVKDEKRAEKSTGTHLSIRKVIAYWWKQGWKSRHPRKRVLI